MKMTFLFLLECLTLVAPALADPYPQVGACDSAGQPALHRIEFTGGSPETTLYVDDENYALGNGVWVYTESNGAWVDKPAGVYFEGLSNANLQRGGSSPFIPDDNELCIDEGGISDSFVS